MRDPIVYAIPIFMLAIVVEWLIGRRRQAGNKIYRLNDAISNLGTGIGNRLVIVLFGGVFFSIYSWCFERFAPFQLPGESVGVWILAFVLGDYSYYWWHRLSHRVNVFWAIHTVHHQSEEYNLAVALRQAWLSPFSYFPFLLVFAFLGFPPTMVFVCSALNLVYQFWIHTRLIGRMGFLESFMNTPSHHRVHHGINLKYLDKNYAGVFIVWDKMFGTFEQEGEEVVYGVVSPLHSWSPVWANVEPFAKVFGQVRLAFVGGSRSLRMSVRTAGSLLFRGPEWTPQGPALPPAGVPRQKKYNAMNASSQLALGMLVLVLTATFIFLWYSHELSTNVKFSAAIVLTGLTAFNSWLIDSRPNTSKNT